MRNDLVSIIMLSHGDGTHVVETVKSILAQTYQNWELLFVAKTNDETLESLSSLREEDVKIQKMAGKVMTDSYSNSRIKASFIVGEDNDTPRRNAALANAKGRWMAFLDPGDIWEPTKLEKQVAFMEENGYSFTYTKYKYIDKNSKDRGDMMGGLSVVTHKDLINCCWMGYMTVMYDTEKLGRFRVRKIEKHNDYALWMDVSEKADCYLLGENLAKMRTPWGMMGRLLLTKKIKWRYEVYRIEENLNPFVSGLMTLRNMVYGLVKWGGHVSKFRVDS